MIKHKFAKHLISLFFLFILGYNVIASDTKGLLPVNRDGFEAWDWRNFRPHYVGDSDEWIRAIGLGGSPLLLLTTNL